MNLQITDIEQSRRCIEMQFAHENLKLISCKKIGYAPLNAENSLIFTGGLITANVLEKINFLLSVLSVYYFLFFDVDLNTQSFVYLEIGKYRLGLRRNRRIFTKCNSCMSAIDSFYIHNGSNFLYIQNESNFLPISKLVGYLFDSRVSKFFVLGLLLI